MNESGRQEPTFQDWEQFRHFEACLRPFKEATLLTSGSINTGISGNSTLQLFDGSFGKIANSHKG